MKSILKFIVLAVTIVSTLSFSTSNQTEITVTAVYDGLEDYGYNFIVKKGDVESTLTFQEIEESALLKYDLVDDIFIGKTFKVTYTVMAENTEDEDDETELMIIVDLEKK